MFYCEVEGLNCVYCLCQTRYIMDELKDKSNTEIDASSWVVEVSDCLPLQHNGYFFLLILITA
jgi:Zn-finger protein